MSDRRHIETQDDGLSDFLHFDHDGNPTGIQYTQDVEPVLDWCKAASDGPAGAEFRHVGRYPVGELILYGKLNGINDPAWYLKKQHSDLLSKLVNDSEHKKFRVWSGRV